MTTDQANRVANGNFELDRETISLLLDIANDGGVCPTPSPIMAELCRAWLALDSAPEVEVTKRSATFGHGDCGVQWVIGDSYSPPPLIAQGMYVKYRLVPVVEATPASGGPRDG